MKNIFLLAVTTYLIGLVVEARPRRSGTYSPPRVYYSHGTPQIPLSQRPEPSTLVRPTLPSTPQPPIPIQSTLPPTPQPPTLLPMSPATASPSPPPLQAAPLDICLSTDTFSGRTLFNDVRNGAIQRLPEPQAAQSFQQIWGADGLNRIQSQVASTRDSLFGARHAIHIINQYFSHNSRTIEAQTRICQPQTRMSGANQCKILPSKQAAQQQNLQIIGAFPYKPEECDSGQRTVLIIKKNSTRLPLETDNASPENYFSAPGRIDFLIPSRFSASSQSDLIRLSRTAQNLVPQASNNLEDTLRDIARSNAPSNQNELATITTVSQLRILQEIIGPMIDRHLQVIPLQTHSMPVMACTPEAANSSPVQTWLRQITTPPSNYAQQESRRDLGSLGVGPIVPISECPAAATSQGPG